MNTVPEFEITFSLTNQFPNNTGEIGIYDLNNTPFVFEKISNLEYALQPEIWIGAKSLFGLDLPVYYDKPERYLVVHKQPGMSINRAISDYRAAEISLIQAQRIIQESIADGFITATNSKVSRSTVLNLKANGLAQVVK